MAYVVLARKWRPQRFSDVLGQEHVTQTLTNAINAGRIAHAFLFSGPRGVGKTSAARILSKALCCEAGDGPTAEPCGVCRQCVEITEGRSTDIFEIDAASHTGVDNIREIIDNARYLPSSARFKIYVIDEVHMLSQGAFNALLKTLEEPPGHVKFILATTDVHKVPVTVKSRCQRYDFRRIALSRIAERLSFILTEEKIDHDPSALSLVAREAEGSMRDAQSLLEQVLAFAADRRLEAPLVREALGVVDSALVDRARDALLGHDPGAIIELVQDVHTRGLDLARFIGAVIENVRDLLAARVVKDPKAVLDRPEDEIQTLVDVAQQVSTQTLERLFEQLCRIAEDVGRSAHPRFALEVGLASLAEKPLHVPLDHLVAQLDRVEGLLSGAPAAPGGGRSDRGPPSGGGPRGSGSAHRRGPAGPPPSGRPSAPGTPSRPREPSPRRTPAGPEPGDGGSEPHRGPSPSAESPPAPPPTKAPDPSVAASGHSSPPPAPRDPEPPALKPEASVLAPTPEPTPLPQTVEPEVAVSARPPESAAPPVIEAQGGEPADPGPTTGAGPRSDHGPTTRAPAPPRPAERSERPGASKASASRRPDPQPARRPAAAPEDGAPAWVTEDVPLPDEPGPPPSSALPPEPPPPTERSPARGRRPGPPAPPPPGEPAPARGPRAPEPEAPDPHAPIWTRFEEPFAQFVGFVRRRRPALAATLMQVRPLAFGEDGILLGCETSFDFKKLEAKETQDLLAELLEAHLGRTVPVRVQKGTDAPAQAEKKTLSEVEDEHAAQVRSEKAQTARGHPGVNAVVDALSGTIANIRVLDG